MRFAGSVSCFTSIAIDRARTSRSSPVARSCQRSIGSVSTASKRRHMAWCCVCMHVNETGHAQRLNMLKERPRKWFFREEVDFLASLAFVVRSYHRPPASPSEAIFIPCACLSVRYQTPFSSRHESGPSWFLSTGKHPVGGQLPRVFFLCSAWAEQRPSKPTTPQKTVDFSVSFRQYSESNLRSMQWTREAKNRSFNVQTVK